MADENTQDEVQEEHDGAQEEQDDQPEASE